MGEGLIEAAFIPRVEPSAESASNLEPEVSTCRLCAPTATPNRLQNPAERRC